MNSNMVVGQPWYNVTELDICIKIIVKEYNTK